MASVAPEPELFGKYELVARIATGGMAEIFRAVSSSIGGFQKVVALKRILPHLSTDAEFVSLFIAEANLAVALTHSNIVQVLDFGRVDQNHYIAMEFVEGKDLTQILIKQSRARKQLPVEAAVYMLAETARALEYAHARKDRDGTPLGIVHRDVSPHNILVSYDGEVKLTDFGIAKAKNHVTLSRPGVILGKFAYMSPEQARGDTIDPRTDIYAAGITLYETLTGRRLFYSEDPLATLAKVRNPQVPLPSRYNPRVTPELDALVMRALAPDPRDRFQTARELSTALTTYLARTRPDFTDFDIAQFMRDAFGDEVDAAKFSLASRGASNAIAPAITAPQQPARDVLPGDPRPAASAPDRLRGSADGRSAPVLLDSPKPPAPRGSPVPFAESEGALRAALASASLPLVAVPAPGSAAGFPPPSMHASAPEAAAAGAGSAAGPASVRATGATPVVTAGPASVRITGAMPVVSAGPSAPRTTVPTPGVDGRVAPTNTLPGADVLGGPPLGVAPGLPSALPAAGPLPSSSLVSSAAALLGDPGYISASAVSSGLPPNALAALDEDSATHDAAQRATPLDPRLTPPGGMPTVEGSAPRGPSQRPTQPAILEDRAATPVIPSNLLLRALEEARGTVPATERSTPADPAADPRLRRALERLATAPDTVDLLEAETLAPGRLGPPPVNASLIPSGGDPVVESLTARLLTEPNLWLLAELGQRFVQLGRTEDGARCLRVAAMKFAQNGLLVQALALYVELIEVTHRAPQTFREISALSPLAGRPSKAVLELLAPLPAGPLGRLLESLVMGSEPSRVAEMLAAPLFSFLGPEELARFAALLRLRRVPPATTIVAEGQRGQSLYLIARGRVIIYCQNYQGERVYLSSLSDGDCFGEFSFFTGEPRAATVETADYVTLFEIPQQDFDRVIDEFPSLTRALLRLYKDRVIATLLAKSEVFGVLPPRARGALLDRLEMRRWDHGQLIIEEGARDGAFYLVKSGEVEVFSQRNGYVLLSKLKAGDFFGEIAALTGQPRTASVRALCPVECLELSAAHLKVLLDANPDMSRVLERRIKQREGERALRVTAGGILI